MMFWVRNLPTIPKANECFADEKNRVSRLVPIRLSDLTSAFLILGIGIGLATLSFLLELIYYNMAKKQLFSALLIGLKQLKGESFIQLRTCSCHHFCSQFIKSCTLKRFSFLYLLLTSCDQLKFNGFLSFFAMFQCSSDFYDIIHLMPKPKSTLNV